MTRTGPSRLGLTVVALLALLALLAGCGDESVRAPSRPSPFAEARVTWAQGQVIHYGEDSLPAGGYVEALWRTPYAFIAEVRRGKGIDTDRDTVFVTEDGSSPLPGSPADIQISPDGRYAGWIDFHGPRRVNGRLAQVVVVDMSTGETVFRNHDQMGDLDDDLADLYEDAEVHFLGFDDDYAYWDTPTGDVQRRRAHLGDWRIEGAEKEAPAGAEADTAPVGLPYDSLVGRSTGMLDSGRASPSGGGTDGFVSPDGHWCFTSGLTGHLTVVDCRSGSRATPAYPEKWVFFGGWQTADTFVVLSRAHYDFEIDPVGKDPSTGVLASCSLTTRRCAVLRHVRATDSIVFATGEQRL